VINGNDFDVSNVNVDLSIPDNFEIEEGTELDNLTLGASEQRILHVVVKNKQQTTTDDKENNGQSNIENGGSTSQDSSGSNNSNSNGTQDSSESNNSNSNSTQDNSSVNASEKDESIPVISGNIDSLSVAQANENYSLHVSAKNENESKDNTITKVIVGNATNDTVANVENEDNDSSQLLESEESVSELIEEESTSYVQTEYEDEETIDTATDNKGNTLYIIILIIAVIIVLIILFVLKKKHMFDKFLAILLCVTTIASIVPAYKINVKAENTSNNTLYVNKSISFGEENYTFSLKVTYDVPQQNTDKTYMRGEWIRILLDKMEIDYTLEDDSDYYFADIEESEYGEAIETAYGYGFIPETVYEGYDDPEQDVPMFFPDEIATREFVAYTVVNCLQFQTGEGLDCLDSGSLAYPEIDNVAVNQSIIVLENGYFNPQGAFNEADKNRVFALITYLDGKADGTYSEDRENIEYADDVIAEDLEKFTDYEYTINDDEITVSVTDGSAIKDIISLGSIAVFPATDDNISGIALKVNEIHEDEGKVIIVGSVPDISEVYEHVSIACDGTADIDGITAADGITVEYDSNGTISGSENQRANNAFDKKVPGTLKFNLGDGIKINDKVKLTGDVKVEIPNVRGEIDADFGLLSGLKVNEFLVSVREKINVESTLTYTAVESGNTYDGRFFGGKKELGRITIALGATGFTFDFVLFFEASIKGTVRVSYNIDATQGYQYINGNGRWIWEYNHNITIPELKGSMSALMGVDLNFTVLSLFDIIGIDGKIGPVAEGSFTVHGQCQLVNIEG
jgi:hypothetical protein